MPRARKRALFLHQQPPAGVGIKVDMQAMLNHPAAPARGLPSGTAQVADREFDLWLQRELSRLHGDVLHEPVPEGLMRIIAGSSAPRD